MAASWMMMLVMLLGNGGNHLLDYASTREYWSARGIVLSVDTLSAELRASETDDPATLMIELSALQREARRAAANKIMRLGEAVLPQLRKAAESPDPELSGQARRLLEEISAGGRKDQVRRLMAIRALGELGQKEALPILRPLADSREMFIGEYARRAIAAIEGKPYESSEIAAEARQADVAILPGGVRAIIQSTIPGKTKPITLEQLADAVAGPPGMDKQAMLAEMTRAVIGIAEQIGDVRLDGLTVGLAGDIGNDHGFAAVIVRGEYDAAAVKAMLDRVGLPKRAVEGADVYAPQPQFALLLDSNQRGAALLGPRFEALPAAQLVRAMQAGKGPLADDPQMAPLLAKADKTLPLWGVMHVTDAFREAPALAPFDHVILAGRRSGEKLDATLTAQGNDPARVKETVEMINVSVRQALPQLKQMAQQMPSFRAMAEMMESIQASADGNEATLKLTMPQDSALLMPTMLFGVRAAPAAPPPAPVKVQE